MKKERLKSKRNKKAIVLRLTQSALVAGACGLFCGLKTSCEIVAVIFILFYAFLDAIQAAPKKKADSLYAYATIVGIAASIALTVVCAGNMSNKEIIWLVLYYAWMLAGGFFLFYQVAAYVITRIWAKEALNWKRLAQAAGVAVAVALSYGAVSSGIDARSVLLGFIVALLFYGAARGEPDRRVCTAADILAVIFALACTLVRHVDVYSAAAARQIDTFVPAASVLRIAEIAVSLTGLFILYRGLLRGLIARMLPLSAIAPAPGKWAAWKVFCVCVIVMLVAWTPLYICSFPANLSPDSFSQIAQAIEQAEASDAHAYIYTLCMKGVFSFALKDPGATLSSIIAWFTGIQMLCVAAGFSYLVTRLYALNIRRGICVAALAYFALLPIHAEYSFTLWKDVPFSLFVMLFSLTLWEMIAQPQARGVSRYLKAALLFVSCACTLLFRSNAIYAAVLAVPIFVWMLIKRSRIAASACLVAIALAVVVKFPIYSTLGLSSSDTIESLSIPAQQIARVIADEKPLSQEETEKLGALIDLEQVKDNYRYYLSDPIKKLVRKTGDQSALKDDPGGYARLWLQLGVKYPYQYLSAHIAQTQGYWYPDVQYWVCYNTWSDKNNCNLYPIVSDTAVTACDEWIYAYASFPVYGLVWSIGFAVWVAMTLAAVCFVKRKTSALPAYLPIAIIWLVLLFSTPVCAEFRYLYALFTTLPLLCVIPFSNQPEDLVERPNEASKAGG